MRRLGVAVLCIGGLACGRQAGPSGGCEPLRLTAAAPAANLVFVVNDTMRRDRVGAYGGPAATPVFDGFARRNLFFRYAVSQAPWTKPAIASLFTGLYPSQHGVLDDPRMPGRASRTGHSDALPSGLATLAELLHDAGFRTAAFVSNPWLDRGFGFAQGFETYRDAFARFDAPGELVTEAGLDWLRQLEPGERFFLYLHYIDSHRPYGNLSVEDVLAERERLEADPRPVPAEALEALHELRTPDGQSLLLASGVRPTLAVLERAYEAGLADFDRALGALLAGLESAGVYAESAVVITSDHGEAFFERGYGNHARALFDDELAVPLAARLPGVEPARAEVECSVGLVDWLPTLCDYFGLSCPPGDGVSLFAGVPQARRLAAEGVPGHPAHRSLRAGGFKLIYEPDGPLGLDLRRDAARGRAQPWSLYDLGRDPQERRDLLADGPPSAEAERAFAALREALAAAPAPARNAPAAAVDAQVRRRLEELGYAEPAAGGPEPGD